MKSPQMKDKVNEEAILFANWSYRLLHDAIIPLKTDDGARLFARLLYEGMQE